MIKPDSLKGFYKPVKLSEALIYFVNHGRMNIQHGNQIINFIDFLPMLKQGYALNNTISLLMHSYIRINKLRHGTIFKLDDNMNKAFNDMPAQYFITGPYQKWLMNDAVNQGLLPKVSNTFECVQLRYNQFNIEEIKLLYIEMIKVFNITLLNNIGEDTEFAKALCYEYYLINEINKLFKLKCTDLTKMIASNIGSNILITHLVDHQYITHEYVNLIKSIVNYNIDYIKQSKYDCRNFNYALYDLAVKDSPLAAVNVIKNDEIINLIMKNIIERNWVEKQVFNIYIDHIHGCQSNLPDILYSISRAIL